MNAADDGLAGIQQLAGDATLLYYMTEEAQEGKNAYLEKRRPEFDQIPQAPVTTRRMRTRRRLCGTRARGRRRWAPRSSPVLVGTAAGALDGPIDLARARPRRSWSRSRCRSASTTRTTTPTACAAPTRSGTPIAGHAALDDGRLWFRGQILSIDGTKKYDVSRTGAPHEAHELGLAAADEILSKADAAVLARSSA